MSDTGVEQLPPRLLYYPKPDYPSFLSRSSASRQPKAPAELITPDGRVHIAMPPVVDVSERNQRDTLPHGSVVVFTPSGRTEADETRRRRVRNVFYILSTLNYILTTLLYSDVFETPLSHVPQEEGGAIDDEILGVNPVGGVSSPHSYLPQPFDPATDPSSSSQITAMFVAVWVMGFLGLWGVLHSSINILTLYMIAMILNFFLTVTLIPGFLYLLRYFVDIALFHTARKIRSDLMCQWFVSSPHAVL